MYLMQQYSMLTSYLPNRNIPEMEQLLAYNYAMLVGVRQLLCNWKVKYLQKYAVSSGIKVSIVQSKLCGLVSVF